MSMTHTVKMIGSYDFGVSLHIIKWNDFWSSWADTEYYIHFYLNWSTFSIK